MTVDLKWAWVCMCVNEMYGTGRLLLKAQVGTKRAWVRKGSWKPSAKNYSCESQGSKNRLTNLPLWHRSLMWLPATSSKDLARPGLVLSSLKLPSNSLISRTSFHPCTREQWRPTFSVKIHACAHEQAYLHRSICLSLYMPHKYTVWEAFWSQQNQTYKRNPSLEEEIDLLSPDSCLPYLDWNGYN